MSEYGGRGDPQRSLALLWGTEKATTRGPNRGLSVAQIVAAAIALADADGLAALSMRRVAEQLKVGAMSLYTYVPGKAELLDVMLDTVFGEERQPDSATGDWRARLELRAREDWALYQRHPWILQVASARAILGPNETALFESALAAVDGIGLSGREMVSVVTLVGGYVRGAAQGALEAARAEQHTGQSDEQWWSEHEPLFDAYFDAARYPTLIKVEADGGFGPPTGDASYNVGRALDDFEFGLQRVLDGIATFVQGRAADDAARRSFPTQEHDR